MLLAILELAEVELPHPADANVPVRASTAKQRTTLDTRSLFRPEESTGGERISASFDDRPIAAIPPARRAGPLLSSSRFSTLAEVARECPNSIIAGGTVPRSRVSGSREGRRAVSRRNGMT